jgi:hypothetical protein
VITLPHRNLVPALAVAFSLALGCLLVGATAASANTVTCAGGVKPSTTAKDKSILDYSFSCSEDLKAYSIVSSMSLGEFSTETVVTDATGGPVSGQAFRCEGDIPSDGFGCSGTATGGNVVTGHMATESNRCVNGKSTLRIWVVAVDANSAASGPMSLAVDSKCPKPKKKKAGHKKHGHKTTGHKP